MKTFVNLNRWWSGVFGVVLCLALQSGSTAGAQEVTAKTLVDRAQVQDLITRYYYNFGKENAESFQDFYADDAELILGDKHFAGKEGIAKAYAPRSGGSPMSKAYSFNVTISNPLIIVHGNTASSQLTFTEYLIDKEGDAPHIRTQGREYSTFVKANGKWRYKSRQIKGGTQAPDGWKE
jgi:ketosteroid isomerase-like protein